MAGKNKIVRPQYQEIAVDIANNIIKGKYSVGERVSGRSTLASHYGVSAETIRRAVAILQDVGILSVTKGSGIHIVSMEKTFQFVEQYQKVRAIGDVRKDIIAWVNKQKQEQEELLENISSLLDITERFDEINPFTPFALHITKGMKHIGKTSGEVNFWQNTGATIIAVKRDTEMILSPGPYTSFQVDDILYFIGEKDCLERVKKLFAQELF